MELWQQLAIAWKGGIVWKRLRRKWKIGKKDVVLFMIEQDEELNRYAYIHAEALLHKKYSTKLVLVSPFEDVLGKIPERLRKYPSILISSMECEQLKKYYQLVEFSDYVCFVSMTWPESNWVYRLLGKNGVGKEEIVCLGLFVLRHVPQKGINGL